MAATTTGLRPDAIRPENAAAPAAAGLQSVIAFPVLALPPLGRSSTPPCRDDSPAEIPDCPYS
ncbi:hypothetical protein ACPCSQ_17845 [Streptomyces griseoincarnatus]